MNATCSDGLNQRQRRFADLVLEGHAQGRAYELAGYKARGDSADVNASRLLGNARVAAYLAERRRVLLERSSTTAEAVIEELAAMAFYDPAEIAGHRLAGPDDIATLPEHVRPAIVGWSWDPQGRFVPRLANRLGALDLLARYLGLFQRDRVPDERSSDSLLTTPIWRYVFALHVTDGISIAEAEGYARRNPDRVTEWAREVGLIPA